MAIIVVTGHVCEHYVMGKLHVCQVDELLLLSPNIVSVVCPHLNFNVSTTNCSISIATMYNTMNGPDPHVDQQST